MTSDQIAEALMGRPDPVNGAYPAERFVDDEPLWKTATARVLNGSASLREAEALKWFAERKPLYFSSAICAQLSAALQSRAPVMALEWARSVAPAVARERAAKSEREGEKLGFEVLPCLQGFQLWQVSRRGAFQHIGATALLAEGTLDELRNAAQPIEGYEHLDALAAIEAIEAIEAQ